MTPNAALDQSHLWGMFREIGGGTPITHYRDLRGEHPDRDSYRAAIVADRRVLLRVTLERGYGRVQP